ncbi:DUF1810 domain-containing protein [Flavobacterium sp. NRK1]|uniref:DUF1810 domain-containing protein n=1 Tax=Flavobacterium sp. NRK1 TaxID=2954929 RepID=UPI002093478A|nr:DUF1810 domain-containing protein [Flavobacterium sp. NRK1]MCO6148925.1 DUF1810 domain-containing protein [Flavobacterium sp. NRK1]
MGLERFLSAQEGIYAEAISEIKQGRKQSHWMWFIFPQLKGLGHSATAEYYGITDLDEARHYLEHPVLGKRLVEISKALLELEGADANAIFGYPDDLKLQSSMTLFSRFNGANPVFKNILEKYYNGQLDRKTLFLIDSKRKL